MPASTTIHGPQTPGRASVTHRETCSPGKTSIVRPESWVRRRRRERGGPLPRGTTWWGPRAAEQVGSGGGRCPGRRVRKHYLHFIIPLNLIVAHRHPVDSCGVGPAALDIVAVAPLIVVIGRRPR